MQPSNELDCTESDAVRVDRHPEWPRGAKIPFSANELAVRCARRSLADSGVDHRKQILESKKSCGL